MQNKFYLLLVLLLMSTYGYAQISTPGTGTHWNIDSLVQAFPGYVQDYEENGQRIVEITGQVLVSPSDTLELADIDLALADTAKIESEEAHIIFNNLNIMGLTTDTFPRMRFDLSTVVIQNSIFNKGAGISFIDSECFIDESQFIETLSLERGVGSAISLFRTKGVILNSVFEKTESAAISSGINAAIGVRIDNCLFYENNTANKNSPQLNFADTAEGDSIVITNCEIIGKYEMAGGIGITNLSVRESKAIIENNRIIGNRYGITAMGSKLVTSIQGNKIIGNNIQNNPNLGGSGINLLGDESNVSYIGGNHIEDNLWGLTIQASKPAEFIAPLPYLSEPDGQSLPYPTSRNAFVNNGNSGQIYALFNMNDETIYARENYWNTADSAEIEDAIYHQNDDPELGLVIYEDFLLVHPDSTTVATQTPAYAQYKELNIHPNPLTSGNTLNLTQDPGAGTMNIFNRLGEQVYQRYMPRGETSLSLEVFPGEYYIIYRADNGSNYSSKLIVIQ